MPQPTEIRDHDKSNEEFKKEDKFSLGDEISFTGFVNEFGDIVHRFMHLHLFNLEELGEAEENPEEADQQSPKKKAVAVGIKEGDGGQIGDDKVGLAGESGPGCPCYENSENEGYECA